MNPESRNIPEEPTDVELSIVPPEPENVVLGERGDVNGKPMNAFERFEKSAIGKFIEIAAATAFAAPCANILLNRMSSEEAWNEFRSHHHEQSEILYPTLENVPESQRETVFKQRDHQYVDRVKDGLRLYIERNLPRATTPELRHALHQRVHEFQKRLEQFRPSVYDRALLDAGMGSMVRTDHPFPVVQFMNLDNALAGEHITTSDAGIPDTIYVDTDPTNAWFATEVMEHEYLHTTQSGYEHGDRISHQPATDHLEKLGSKLVVSAFNEGSNELLRGKLNTLLKRQFHQAYPKEVHQVQTIEKAVGSDNFWHTYAKGRYADIETSFNQHIGVDKFHQLFTSNPEQHSHE